MTWSRRSSLRRWSLSDLSHNIWERAAVIPNITAGDVVSSDVTEHSPEEFSSTEQKVGWGDLSEFPLWLCCKSLPVRLAEVRKRTCFQRRVSVLIGEGEFYGEVVGPKGGEGGPRRIREEMPVHKGNIWRGGLALRGEASREILVHNSRYRTVAKSGHCPVIPCSGEPGGMMGIKVAKHHLVSTVHQKGVPAPDLHTEIWSRQDEHEPAPAPALSVWTPMHCRVYKILPASQPASFSQNWFHCVGILTQEALEPATFRLFEALS